MKEILKTKLKRIFICFIICFVPSLFYDVLLFFDCQMNILIFTIFSNLIGFFNLLSWGVGRVFKKISRCFCGNKKDLEFARVVNEESEESSF